MTRVRCAAAAAPGAGAIETTLDAPPRALVRGAETELREVFSNLVVNAAESMPGGGTVRVAVRQDGPNLVVSVADAGCGIPPDVLPRLFEPFFSTKGDRGNGLGLSIAQGIVRRHGGEIRIESEAGKGTTVRVELPRIVGDVLPPVAAADPETAGGHAVPGGGPARFLIVDDDPSVLRVLGHMLEQTGVAVDAAIGGDAALAKIDRAQEPYSCVVTDIHMPTVSGLDVASAVRRRHPLTRVVLMSGCGTTLETALGSDRGISETLRKPFTLEAVRRLARAAD
jgi:CheY-like chemotaxis protein/anti-sigma regulatory factor (Ser/Thr protein kinase)